MSASKTERLLALALVLLNSRRPLTRSELREAVLDYPRGGDQKAFERMFERDKDELRTMGLPIESVEVDSIEGTGYAVARGHAFLPPITVTDDERLALAIASRVWQEANWGHAATAAVRKLELVGDFETNARPHFQLSFPVDSDALPVILRATSARQMLVFNYRKVQSSDAEVRSVEPWGAVAANGQWYLVGFDVDKEAQRAFRLSRVVGSLAIKKPRNPDFTIPDHFDVSDLIPPDAVESESADVLLRVQPGRAASLRTLAMKQDDDTIVISMTNRAATLSEILRAGPSAEVIEPQWLRDEVVASIRKIVERCQQPVAPYQDALAKEVARQNKQTIESSTEQLGRLLALIPWLRARQGATYEQAAEQFGVTPEKVRKDLELAICTEFGAHLVTLDIDAWSDSIYVRDPQGIDAPLQLTQSEAFSLLIGLNLLTQSAGSHDIASIASVTSKLRDAVGADAELANHVHVVSGQDEAVKLVADAISASLAQRRALEIDYLSVSSDVQSSRIVDPIGLIDTQSVQYLQAWCRTAGAVRLFRLDRVQQASVLDEPLVVHDDSGPLLTSVEPEGPSVVVKIAGTIAWWSETVPAQAVVACEDGGQIIQLRVATPEWILRTAMGFGGEMEILSPDDLRDSFRQRADATLAMYSE